MPPATVSEPARETPVVAETDVLVVGGGSAGLAAAVAARRQGARAMLVERYGSLGGLATNGLIILLLTMDDGNGRQVVAGLCQEMVDRLSARGACYFPPKESWNSPDPALVEHEARMGLVNGRGDPHRVRYSVAYDPGEFKVEADQLCLEAGVDLRFHRWAVGVVKDGPRITHVLFESKAGREAIACRAVIDATGDADIAAFAGEPFELERVHPWLWFRTAGVDMEAAEQSGQRARYFRLTGPGGFLHPWGAAERIARDIDATNPDDLTYAEVECRRLVREELDRLRARVPGFERAWLAGFAQTLGITESRRLLGRYLLRREDMDAAPFEDTIAITGNWTKYESVYHIPYRSLCPQGTDNLLVAGRCISADHRAHHSTKEIPPCFATGEAAGVGAAVALQHGQAPVAVDVAGVRAKLAAAGAIV